MPLRSISLWSVKKKKPVFTKVSCHETGKSRNVLGIGIVSIAALHYSDVFASGSNLGSIKIWKVDPKKISFSEILDIPMVVLFLIFILSSVSFRNYILTLEKPGFINSLKLFTVNISENPRTQAKLYLAAGVGKEHRNGRWTTPIREARNLVCTFELV